MDLHIQLHKAYDPDSLIETVEASVKITSEHAKAFAKWCLRTDALLEFPVDQAYEKYLEELTYE